MAKTKTHGFRQDTDGTWIIDTKVKVNGVFKHFTKRGYVTLGAAKADFERAKAEFITSKQSYRSIMFFEDLVDEYENMRKIKVDISTAERDMSDFNVYMFPYFKGKLIKDVFKQNVIHNWYRDLVGNPKITNNKKSKVITRIKDLLKFAYMHKYINAEVYQDCDVGIYQVKVSKKPEHERIIWTEDEEKAFLEATSSDKRDSLMFRLFLLTSPRLGEFLALQPCCFDKDKNRIIITQQVKNIRGQGVVLTGKLKTNESYRTIVIPSDLAEELKTYIDDFNIMDNQYIWHSFSKNKPLSRNSVRRLFAYYCDKAGVRQMNLHALRHNQAVKLASVCHTGEEIEVAARRLGHSPSMFMNTYANHTNDKTESELLKRMLG